MTQSMSNDATLKDRLTLIAQHYGLSIRAMEERCGLGRSNINNMSPNGSLGSDKLSKIVDTFSRVDPTWLLTGRGEMFKPQILEAAEPEPPEYVSKNRDARQIDRTKPGLTRPRIPFTAAAGALSVSADSATESDCERFPIIPNFPDYDFTIKVDGESMCPVFQPDDELACRLVDDVHNVKWGQPYILDTRDGIVLKVLYDGGDEIMCKSINKDGPAPYEVCKSDVLHIASIVGFTRQLQP